MVKADTARMKQINKQNIRECFIKKEIHAASDLSEETGLSVVTVNHLLKEMIREGEVIASEERKSKGGRPGVIYEYNTMFRSAVIIYGLQKNRKDCIICMVIDRVGRTVYQKERAGENVTEKLLEELLSDAIKEFPTVATAVFGLPGTETDQIIMINDYKDIIGSNFLKKFAEKYKITVAFLNDINAAVKGMYHEQYKEKDNRTIVGIFYPGGYPPGMGLMINGRIHTGYLNFAGEISYAPLGIDWKSMDYAKEEVVTEAMARVVAAAGAVLAPDLFVLYGEFLRHEAVEQIGRSAEEMMRGKFICNIILSHDFEQDFMQGMKSAALEELRKIEGE